MKQGSDKAPTAERDPVTGDLMLAFTDGVRRVPVELTVDQAALLVDEVLRAMPPADQMHCILAGSHHLAVTVDAVRWADVVAAITALAVPAPAQRPRGAAVSAA